MNERSLQYDVLGISENSYMILFKKITYIARIFFFNTTVVNNVEQLNLMTDLRQKLDDNNQIYKEIHF